MNETPDELSKEIPEETPDIAPKEAQYGAPVELSKDNGCRVGCWTACIFISIMVFIFMDGLTYKPAYSPSPKKPEITHGEFPFRLEYEIDGEVKVIEYTIMFDYWGAKRIGDEEVRNWVRTFAGGGEDLVLLNIEEPANIWMNGEIIKQTVFYEVRAGDYYMEGPHENGIETEDPFRYAYICSKHEDGIKLYIVYSSDELYKDFKIRIISWAVAEPIANTFK